MSDDRWSRTAAQLAELEESRRAGIHRGGARASSSRRATSARSTSAPGRARSRSRSPRSSPRCVARRQRARAARGGAPARGGLPERHVRRGRRARSSTFGPGRSTSPAARARSTTCTGPELVVAELARVTRFGGRVLVIDQIAPGDPLVAVELDRFERARDPSHTRLLPDVDVRSLLEANGLVVIRTRVRRGAARPRPVPRPRRLRGRGARARGRAGAAAARRRSSAGIWPSKPLPRVRRASAVDRDEPHSPALPTSPSSLGANVQPGQIVTVGADHGQYELARGDRGERLQARREVRRRPVLRSVRQARADRLRRRRDAATSSPPGSAYRMLALGEERAARISLAGPTTTGPARRPRPGPRRARPASVRQGDPERDLRPDDQLDGRAVPDRAVGAARLSRPGAGRGARPALGAGRPRLPARRARPGRGVERARRRALRRGRTAQRPAVRRAPLRGARDRPDDRAAPTSTFHAARDETVDGIVHLANLPTEEVYATPDPQRADGHVRSTKPLVLADGTIIRGLEVRFEGGRAVEIDAEQGAGVMRGRAAFDEGAVAARRGRARRPRGPHRPARNRLLRHAARRERREPHRARRRLRTRASRRRTVPAGTAARSTSTS